MSTVRRLFLPGAGGSAGFWKPVADRLPDNWPKTRLAWPGLGDEPHDPSIGCLDNLVGLVSRAILAGDGQVDLIGQSMGGLVAIRAVLRHPDRIRRLVLTGTSGSVDVAALGGADWREDYRRVHPHAVRWIAEVRVDHTAELSRITAPTLLLWGDADPVSPLAVARHLLGLLPNATLEIVPGGDHAFPFRLPDLAAPPIRRHLA